MTDVIDPLGGSYYVETLTDQMQAEIEAVIARIDAAGGMFKAVEDGLVQRMIGESALAHQSKIESGEQTLVGVNAYQVEEDPHDYRSQPYPEPASIDAHIARLKAFKRDRSNTETRKSTRRSCTLRARHGKCDGEHRCRDRRRCHARRGLCGAAARAGLWTAA